MFGQLDYNPDHPDTRWTVSYFLCRDLAPPETSPARATALGVALGQVKAAVVGITPAQLDALKAVALCLPLDASDLASDLYLALAHVRLPDAQRSAREARIAGVLDLFFHDTPSVSRVTTGIGHLKRLAPLAPDAFLESMLRSQAARLQMVAMNEPSWAAHFAASVHTLDARIGALGIQAGTPAAALLLSTWFSRPVAERAVLFELLGQAARQHLGDAVQGTQAALEGRGLLIEAEGEMLVRVLQDCMAAGLDGSMTAEVGAIVRNQVALGCAADDARAQAVIDATIQAVRAEVPMGARVRQQNEAAIAAAGRVWWQQQLLMTPQRLRLHRKLAASASAPARRTGADPARPADLDPVSAWSVQRLVQWIGGPIAEQAPPRLDRGAVLVQENKSRRDARARTQPPDTGRRTDPDIDLGEEEIEGAVQDALCTTAGFFVGDLEDMLFRGQALACTSPALQACADLLKPLREVAQGQADNDQAVRALLHRVEQALDRLRRDIRASEADARTRQRFATQLQAALFNETMAEGKRHGGVIACPLHREDWTWVAEHYHRRWLPWVRQVEVDGVAQPLQPDQALGLYVTGRSLSGHEFDVSVHLWQRRPGRHGAAGIDGAPFSPMNTADWIDTLTPCLVLHVPSAT